MGFIVSPTSQESRHTIQGFDAVDTNLTVVTSGASHAKGTWTAITTSSAHDAHGIIVHEVAMVDGDYLIDIGIGAGGSEVIIVADILSGTRSDMAKAIYLPLFIPSGTRFAARSQSSAASSDNIAVSLIQRTLSGMPLYRKCTTYGADASDSGGTSVDPGATANTKGAYTQITSSTSQDHFAWLFLVGMQANIARTDCQWLVDVALGAAASEVNILENYPLIMDSTYDNNSCVQPILFYQTIPASSRISVRTQCSITNPADRTLDFTIMAFS